jgi:cytochrome c
MSKSPNILVPALGGTALVLGLAYGFSSRNYGADRIETLETRVEQVVAQASSASAQAAAEAARAAELERAITEVQAVASTQLAGASLGAPAPSIDGTYGLGRAAHVEEIAAWDVDVLPDGRGLPEGSGDVFTGEEIFAAKCASCHGDFAEGVDNWPVLAGGFDTLDRKDPVKTVGSYWPHLSTVWDYVHRSMPFGEAGTLTADETYAIVAYILYSNDLVDDEFELNHENFKDFEMYNKDGFVIDDRPELEYSKWRDDPCMSDCKEEVKVTMRATFLDVTPAGGGDSVMNVGATAGQLPTFTAAGPSTVAAPAPAPAPAPAAAPAAAAPVKDAASLVSEGERVFRKCKACHEVGEGAADGVGPNLNGLMGRAIGSVDGFAYSPAFTTARQEGRVWDEESLASFLAKPKEYMAGTRMAFAGLRKQEELDAINAYLATFGE